MELERTTRKGWIEIKCPPTAVALPLKTADFGSIRMAAHRRTIASPKSGRVTHFKFKKYFYGAPRSMKMGTIVSPWHTSRNTVGMSVWCHQRTHALQQI